ncbi:MAG: response regulator [Armatimonadetes bacterium]|nr:response regulator [Armatimonadota bacterium]
MAQRILVIEDDDLMQASLRAELEAAGYDVVVAPDGMAAVERAREQPFDLILTDVRMPGISGLDALAKIREEQPTVRSIVVTGYASPEAPVQAIKLHVDDYLLKPFSSDELLHSVRLSLVQLQRGAGPDMEHARREGLSRLLKSVSHERRFVHLHGHSERVAELCLQMARRLRFSFRRSAMLHLAALLHKIGQAELPPYLFEKGELTPEELSLVRNHPLLARELLEPFPELRDISTIVYRHHERWDGGGSPDRLKGREIPLESRVLALVEAFVSLTSERPYRKGRSPAAALKELQREAGSSFDPDLVETLSAVLAGGDEVGPPSDVESESACKARFLIGLGDSYRALGNLKVADSAYREAGQLLELEPEAEPELRTQLERGQVLRLRAEGLHREALERCRGALRFARERNLEFWSARLELLAVSLELQLGHLEGLLDRITAARAVHRVWESGYHLVLADLLESAVLARQGQSAAFRAGYERFLQGIREHRLQELLQFYSGEVGMCVAFALQDGAFTQATADLLAADPETAVTILESLLDSPDAQLRLRVLDLVPALPEAAARQLLSRSHRDQAPVVARKSQSLPVADTAPMLQIYFFGELQLQVGSQLLPDDLWMTRKIRNLFAFLAAHRGRTFPEEQLMDRFWEGAGAKGRHSLHNAVSQIRTALKPYLGSEARHLIAKKREAGYWVGSDVRCWIDLEEFEQRYHRGQQLAGQDRWEEALTEFQRAERLYRGDFLAGTYEEWVSDLQLRTQGHLLEMFAALARYFYRRGKYRPSLDHWKKILDRDSCHEEAHLGVMLCHLSEERASEAIKAYHQCVRILKKELDLPPPPRIMEAYLRLTQGEPVPLEL